MITLALAVKKALEQLGVKTLMEQTEILHATEYSEFGEMAPGLFSLDVDVLNISEGNRYTVVYDGIEYKCICSTIDDGSGTVSVYIGNIGLLNVLGTSLEDTGEPFYYQLAVTTEGEPTGALLVTTDAPHTIAIYTETETIHPIDPKYLPKGGVGHEENKVILPRSAITLDEGETASGYVAVENGTPFVVGETYIVSWGGTTYKTVASLFAEFNMVVIGDVANENFPFFCAYRGGEYGFGWSDEIPDYVEITQETTHKIEPKFLPGVCLPVVELTTVVGTDYTTLSENEQALLNEATATGIPIVLKFTATEIEGATGCAILFPVIEEGTSWIAQQKMLQMFYLTLMYTEGIWQAAFAPGD